MDGLLGVEAEATLKRIASRLVQKWTDPYSRTCRYMKSRVAITLVPVTHRCIWGAGLRNPESAQTTPSGKTVRSFTSSGKKGIPHSPLQLTSPVISTPPPSGEPQRAGHRGPCLQPASQIATARYRPIGRGLLPPPPPPVPT